MAQDSFSVVILAAGKATRFKSNLPKVLHPLAGRPLGEYGIRAALAAQPERVYVIVGHEAERVRQAFERFPLRFIEQKEQLGTGHALMVAREALEQCPSSNLLVIVGDSPLLQPQTLAHLAASHQKSRAAATVLTVRLENPHGYGRIMRGQRDRIRAIIEEKAATAAQAKVKEVSSGILCFSREKLLKHLGALSADNQQKEYLLTDLVAILNRHRELVMACAAENAEELTGINDRIELARVEKILRLRKAESLMREGVTMADPQATIIDPEVEVGADTLIEAGVSLLGKTRVGSGCTIGAHSTIADSMIGDRVIIRPCCIITGCSIAADTVIGPFAHLRDGVVIEEEARIGNFVEVKKSRIGRGTKSLHLTYLGDATLGKKVNIGAGTVTCNYDGEKKNPTVIEDGVFIGSGTMLVAPVRVGQGAYVGAGSTITDDVPPKSLALARATQVNKEGWVERQAKSKSEKAAPQSPAPVLESIRQYGKVVVVELAGRITYGVSSESVAHQVRAVLDSGRKSIVVSLQKVAYIDSSGLGHLVSALASARRAGGDIRLASVPERIMRILEAANLHHAFAIDLTETDSIAGFDREPSV